MSACDVSSSALLGLATISNWMGQSEGAKGENTAQSTDGDSASIHLSWELVLEGIPL